jgi:hypothetical protein
MAIFNSKLFVYRMVYIYMYHVDRCRLSQFFSASKGLLVDHPGSPVVRLLERIRISFGKWATIRPLIVSYSYGKSMISWNQTSDYYSILSIIDMLW